MNSEVDKVAEIKVVFVTAEGLQKKGAIYLGRPFSNDKGIWLCPVGIPGLDLRLPDIGGNNALYSMCQALQLIHSRLQKFVASGGQIFYENEDGSSSGKSLSLPLYFDFK